MSYTNDKEQARADRAANLRHKKSMLGRLTYQSIINELSDIADECSDMVYFDDEEISELLGNDGESDNEFRLIALELQSESTELFARLRSERYHSCMGFDISDIFDEVMTAMGGSDEERWGYDAYLEEDVKLTEYECSLAKTEAKKRLTRYTKEQMLNIFGECFDIALKWLDLEYGYSCLHATLGVMKDDKTALLKAIKRVNDAYDRAASGEFYSSDSNAFDNIIDELPADVWVV